MIKLIPWPKLVWKHYQNQAVLVSRLPRKNWPNHQKTFSLFSNKGEKKANLFVKSPLVTENANDGEVTGEGDALEEAENHHVGEARLKQKVSSFTESSDVLV